jgi:DNA repair protein RadA
LDDLLSGGLETGAITQFYGASNTGKTHLCHLLCVVLPSPYQLIYIDTEGTFRAEKIQSIAKARGLDSKNILCNIYLVQPTDSKQQESYIEEACSSIESNPKIKLLIVDSMMFHYRAEYPGRSGLAERAHRLSPYMHKLHTLAQRNNIAVIITNQSTSNPDIQSKLKDPQPFGGNVISYTSTHVVYLERTSSGYVSTTLNARLVKGPLRRYISRLLNIVECGFRDTYPSYVDE